MRTSEKTEALWPAMLKAKAAFPPIHRTADNPFFKSKYAALPDILTAIEPHLQANGLMLSSTTEFSDAGWTLDTLLIHAPSGQWVAYSYPLNPVKQDPQGMGSATTYAQRYSINAMFWLAPDFDDDGNAASGNVKPSAPAKPKPAAMDNTAQDMRAKLEAALASDIVDAEKAAKVEAKIKAQLDAGNGYLSIGQMQQALTFLGVK